MIFADNVLRVEHQGGYGVEFNALDALKLVDAHHDSLKVAVSDAWREARYNSKFLALLVDDLLLVQAGGPCPLGPEEIDGLLVPPGKDYTLLTLHLITGKLPWFGPAQEKWFKSNHSYI